MGTFVYSAEDFGRAVRSKRKAMGLTQLQLSNFCGLSASFISDLERGKSTVELGRAIVLANTLGLDLAIDERGAK